jgi:lysophospholipase L1-like esterase
MSHLRSAVGSALLVVIAIAVTLVCLEVAFRILGVEPFPAAEGEHHVYEENSRGLRDYEYDYEKQDDVFRIVVTGDSFTYGTGVPSMEDIFVKRLERALNTRAGSTHRFEVINGAQPGYNTPHEYRWLRDEGVKYSPDLFIVVYFFNDATSMGTVAALFRPIYQQAVEGSRGKSVLYSYVKYRILRSVVSRRTTEEYRRAYFEGKGGMTGSGLWEKAKESILSIKALSEEADIKLLFVIFPILIDLDEDYAFQDIHDIVSEYLQENHIETFSLLPAFVEYPGTSESLWVGIVNAHPNEKGHEIAAAALTTYLLDSGLLTR